MRLAKLGENNYLYGKHPSQETKEKQSKAKLGEKNHNYGKHKSQETKDKISKSMKNKKSLRQESNLQFLGPRPSGLPN